MSNSPPPPPAAAATKATVTRFNTGLNRNQNGAHGRHFVITGAGIARGAVVRVYDRSNTVLFDGRVISLLGTTGASALAMVTGQRDLDDKGGPRGTENLTVTVTNPGETESAPSRES